MRQLTIFCIAIILPALAAGQATVISGYAVNWAPPGVYAEPFVPLLSTPSMSFENISPSPVGASNATAGNVAGATNATLSVLPAGPVEQFPPSLFLGSAESSIEAGTEGESRAEASTSTEPRPLELGAASFQDSYGVAQLAENLPQYQSNITEKVRSLKGGVSSANVVAGVRSSGKQLERSSHGCICWHGCERPRDRRRRLLPRRRD